MNDLNCPECNSAIDLLSDVCPGCGFAWTKTSWRPKILPHQIPWEPEKHPLPNALPYDDPGSDYDDQRNDRMAGSDLDSDSGSDPERRFVGRAAHMCDVLRSSISNKVNYDPLVHEDSPVAMCSHLDLIFLIDAESIHSQTISLSYPLRGVSFGCDPLKAYDQGPYYGWDHAEALRSS
eukprot:g38406.t1